MREFTLPKTFEIDPTSNATDLLEAHIQKNPNLALFARQLTRGQWTDVTAQEFRDDVQRIARGLAAIGIEPGDTVAILAQTRYEWTLVDLAIMYAGAITVPIYATSSPSQIAWILEDSNVKAAIVETREQAKNVERAVRAENLTPLLGIWAIDEGELDQLRAMADSDTAPDETEMERRRQIADLNSVATIVYTSGTTGKPKGCMLTHGNLVEVSLSTVHSELSEVLAPGATTVMFIPLAHVFARYIAFLALAAGTKVGHTPNTADLVPDLQSFQPTFLLGVPRVFEKVYNSALQNATSQGKGAIFERGAAAAVAYSQAREAGKIPAGLRLQHWVFDKVLYNKIRAAVGGRMTSAFSGGSALGEHLTHFFRGVGISINEGFGMTETTGPVTINRGQGAKAGSVGRPIPGAGVRIADDGELLVKGVPVFAGYLNLPEKTAEEFTEDGWFKTGDLASIDADGFVTITGRKKEILITASGKNVAPTGLEDRIRADGLVSQVIVVGDNKPFVSAIVTLDAETLPGWLKQRGLDENMSVPEAAQHPKVREHVQQLVNKANEAVSRAESIREFRIADRDFTIEDGQMTPSLKIRRGPILRDFAHLVDDIYASKKVPTR